MKGCTQDYFASQNFESVVFFMEQAFGFLFNFGCVAHVKQRNMNLAMQSHSIFYKLFSIATVQMFLVGFFCVYAYICGNMYWLKAETLKITPSVKKQTIATKLVEAVFKLKYNIVKGNNV